MATCKRCGISGPFVKVNEEGICVLCQNRPDPIKPKNKPSILLFELDPEAVLNRYLTTDHSTYPKGYNVVEYYTAEFDCMLSALREVPVARSLRDGSSRAPECVFYKDLSGFSLEDCKSFVAVDTETSGLTARAEIVEVSAVKFKDFRPVSTFSTLCRPYGKIAPDAAAVHGITDADVRNAPRCAEILDGLEAFTENLPLVAHNAPFDLKMLAKEGMDTYARRVFDTLPLSRTLLRQPDGAKLPRYRLSDACRACAILFSGAHRSTADAMAAGMLFLELVKRHFGKENLLLPSSPEKS